MFGFDEEDEMIDEEEGVFEVVDDRIEMNVEVNWCWMRGVVLFLDVVLYGDEDFDDEDFVFEFD